MDILTDSGTMSFIFTLALCASLLLEVLAVAVTSLGYAAYSGVVWLWERLRRT